MVFMWVQYEPLVYNRTYHYPTWAQVLGLGMACASMVIIPGYFTVRMIMTPGSLKEVTQLLIFSNSLKLLHILTLFRTLKIAKKVSKWFL